MTEFAKIVLNLVKKIPRGKITIYSEVARAAGCPGGARAVGSALNKNPRLIKVPCHRVVKTDGSLGGYVKGIKQKIKILQDDGIIVKKGKVVDFEKILYKF